MWEPSNSDVFVTKPGPFTDLAVAAIEEVTGRKPELSHHAAAPRTRASSRSYCPVIEFGLVGQTMHQIDERTPVADLEKLTRIYRGVLDRYFAACLTPATLWAARLSMTTMSPGRKVGANICSTQARKHSPSIGPSRSIGATKPVSVSPPTKVTVFQ